MTYHFIFDMDGTLIDTEFEVSKITQQLVAAKGFDVAPETVHQLFSGYPSAEKFQGTAALLGGRIDARDLPEMTARHEEMKKALYLKDHVPVVSGIIDLLGHLQQSNEFMSVATSAPKDTADIALRKTKLTPFFGKRIFGSDSSPTGRKKPAPDVYLHAIQQLAHKNLTPVAIEDSVAGVIAAQAARIPTIIAYLDPYFGNGAAATQRAAELKEAGASTIIRSFDDMAPFLAALPAPLHATIPRKDVAIYTRK